MSFIAFKGIELHIGGLCDRLKGLYSCYLLSKALKRDFCYLLTHQEVLESRFTPPRVQGVFHHIVDYRCFMNYKRKIELLDFSPDVNHIIQTNIDFTQYIPELKLVEFNDFMYDLFDIPLFESKHNVKSYDAGIHIRCGGGMVNWDDYNFGVESDINKIKTGVITACERHKDVFLCSDSGEVLKAIKDLNISNLTVTSNIPVHVDRSPVVTEDDTKNVFYDLLTLANSNTIYYTLGEYAKTAARIKNKPLIDLYNL